MVHETLLPFNDGVMALFFFVGLEIKHELPAGKLSTLKRAIFSWLLLTTFGSLQQSELCCQLF
jgi:Na+/H+ antiporter NhaA